MSFPKQSASEGVSHCHSPPGRGSSHRKVQSSHPARSLVGTPGAIGSVSPLPKHPSLINVDVGHWLVGEGVHGGRGSSCTLARQASLAFRSHCAALVALGPGQAALQVITGTAVHSRFRWHGVCSMGPLRTVSVHEYVHDPDSHDMVAALGLAHHRLCTGIHPPFPS